VLTAAFEQEKDTRDICFLR